MSVGLCGTQSRERWGSCVGSRDARSEQVCVTVCVAVCVCVCVCVCFGVWKVGVDAHQNFFTFL